MRRIVLACAALCWGCPSSPNGTTPTATVTSDATAVPIATTSVETPDPKPKPTAAAKTMFVGPQLVDCEGGSGPMKCMHIRHAADGAWEKFYDQIEGFEHEAGNAYELKVEMTEVADPPADASSRRYKLIEIVSKEEAK